MAETKRSAGLPLDGRFRNVAFITTLGTNPGDDFIREGIRWFLGELLGRYNAIYVNKHDPRTLCVRAEEMPWRRWIAQRLGLPTGPARVPPAAQGASFDKLREADLVVQCGGPFYWWTPLWRNYRPRFYRPPDSSCARASWRKAIWDERIAQVSGRVPVLNIGVGSSQPFHSQGEEILADESCRAFIRETYGMCRVTSTRDEVAHSILNALGLPNELLPCPSLFANDALGIPPALPEFVALNFMPGGGHGQCGQALSVREWHETFLALFRHLERRHPVVVVCHSLREWLALRDGIPPHALFYSDRFADYLHLYAQCRAGILNRVHGALALASFGAPAILIGNDTRALAGRAAGLPVRFVSDVRLPELIGDFEALLDRAGEVSRDLLQRREQARQRYLKLLEAALAGGRESEGAPVPVGHRQPVGSYSACEGSQRSARLGALARYRGRFHHRALPCLALLPFEVIGKAVAGLAKRWPSDGASKALLDPRTVLAIELAHTGDVLLTTPALRALRYRFPRARILALVGFWAAPVLRHNRDVDAVLTYDAPWFDRGLPRGPRRRATEALALVRTLRKERIDLAVEFRGDIRHMLITRLGGARALLSYENVTGGGFLLTRAAQYEECHEIDADLRLVGLLGARIEEPHPTLSLGDVERAFVRRVLNDAAVSPEDVLIGMHPGAPTRERGWGPDRFRHLATLLQENLDARVIITGGPDEREIAESLARGLRTPPIMIAGKTSLLEFAALVDSMDLLVCNDGGPMHIAAALGTPVVGLFGPTAQDMPRVHPTGGRARVVVSPTGAMADITVEDVLSAVCDLLGEDGPRPTGEPGLPG